MSNLPAHDPACLDAVAGAIDLIIDARPRDLGGFSVRRVLPSPRRRLVGPFIFFDEMGPAELPPGGGLDVRPHPHIALATVTYLFDGEIMHRDSLGSLQRIRPGDVNWMVAGRGIVHSERSSPETRRDGMRLHGVQTWVALPLEHEEMAPRFEHHPQHSLPRIERDGVKLDVIAGSAFGERSPVGVLSETLYVHGLLSARTRLSIDTEHDERAVYVVEGSVTCDGQSIERGTMAVLQPGRTVEVTSDEGCRIMILGGKKLDGERHMFWNFVSSDKARIERAKQDWQGDRFPRVPGDDERIPLPT